MAEPKRVLTDSSPRRLQILTRVREVFGRLFGLPVDETDLHRSFVEMGADSLALLQASKAIQDNFGVKISFRLLLDEVTTIPHLAEWIDQNLEEELPQVSGNGGSDFEWPSEPSRSSENGLEAEAASDAVQQVYAEHQGLTGLQSAAAAYEFTAGPPLQSAYEAIAAPVDQPAKPQGSETVLASIIREQLQLMTRQLDLLRRPAAGSKASPSASVPLPSTVVLQQAGGETNRVASEARSAGGEATPAIRSQSGEGTAAHKIDPTPYIAYQPLKTDLPGGLNQPQKKALEELIDRINRRTPGSKRLTEEHRPFLADSRVSAGFRLLWKEIAYQIIFERALGARLWDVDGNEYVDITMGFGSLLFGHSPAFIRKALHSQIEQGLQIGPHISLAGRVARLLCEMTGNDRAAFCNSGTEAVMTALRLARTVTGRSKIAIFAGNFHGTFDQMLVKGEDAGGTLKTIPMAPGIPSGMIEDVTLLRYDTSDSRDFLQANAKHFAAIMLAPVPSRRPDAQLKEYIGHLRRIASDSGAVLIFDEVVTGFRVHPGGAQALYGVPADLVTYGKAVGGGMPIGVIAGKSRFMDPIDGGSWRFGDASYPQAETTLFAGTFFKHPLVMASAWAVLNYIRDNHDKIYEPLAVRTGSLADTLNGFFSEEAVPIRVVNFTSFFMFQNSLDPRFADLFFYYLLERGVYVWEGRTCFLSTAHTEADIDYVIVAVKSAVAEMRKAGFLPADREHYSVRPISPDGRLAARAAPSAVESSNGSNSREAIAAGQAKLPKAITIPLTEAQKQILWLSRISADVSSAYNQSLILRMRGPLDVPAIRRAIERVVQRHEALRTTFSAGGDYQLIHPRLGIGVALVDWSDSRPEIVAGLDDYVANEARTAFDLVKGPLLRASIIKLAAESYVLLATFHHIISDGVSLGIFMSELGAIYAADRQQIKCNLPEPKRFTEYAESRIRQDQTQAWKEDEAYWLGQFSDGIPILNLPADYPRPEVQSFAGAQQTHSFDPAILEGVKELSKRQECTLFIALLSAFNVLLRGITRQEDLIVGVLSASQSFTGDYLFGYGVNLLPLRFPVPGGQSFLDYLATVKRQLFDAYEHQDLPFGRLVKKLNPPRDASRPPIANVVFNLDRGRKEMRFFDLEVEAVPVHNGHSKFDLTWYLTDGDNELSLECEYSRDLFNSGTINRWIRQYESILRAVAAQPDLRIVELGDIVEEAGKQLLVESRIHLREATLEKLRNAQRRAFPGI